MWKSAIWVGARNSCLFGHTAEEIEAIKPQWLTTDPWLRTTRSAREPSTLRSGHSSEGTATVFHRCCQPLQQ